MIELVDVVARLEHIQNDFRAIYVSPAMFAAPEHHLPAIVILIDHLEAAAWRWMRAQPERRYHDRRQQDRRAALEEPSA